MSYNLICSPRRWKVVKHEACLAAVVSNTPSGGNQSSHTTHLGSQHRHSSQQQLGETTKRGKGQLNETGTNFHRRKDWTFCVISFKNKHPDQNVTKKILSKNETSQPAINNPKLMQPCYSLFERHLVHLFVIESYR